MIKRTLTTTIVAAVLAGIGASSASAMPPSQCPGVGQYQTAGPNVYVDDAGQVAESAGRARFRVRLTVAPTSPVTVNLCTSDGNGWVNWPAIGGRDYTDVNTSVTFQPERWGWKTVCTIYPRYSCSQQWAKLPAETVKYVDVAITNDTECDNTGTDKEAFELRAHSSNGGLIKDDRGQAIILDDDSCGLV